MSWHRAHRLWQVAGLQLPDAGHGGGWRAHGPSAARRSAPNTSGPTTSCSTPAPTASSSSASPSSTNSPARPGDRCGRQHPLRPRHRGAEPLISERGAPRSCAPTTARSSSARRSSSGSRTANIQTALIDPGKPWQNGTDESFNGKFRDECLSLEWFRSRREAKVIIEAWRQHYNHVGHIRVSSTARRSNSDGITISSTREPSSSNKWSENPRRSAARAAWRWASLHSFVARCRRTWPQSRSSYSSCARPRTPHVATPRPVSRRWRSLIPPRVVGGQAPSCCGSASEIRSRSFRRHQNYA